MIYIRSFLLTLFLYLNIAMGCIVGCCIFFLPQKCRVYTWNYIFIPLNILFLRILTGIKIEIRGRQYLSQGNVIYAAKHQSAMETYILTGYIKRATFILKKELTYIPIFGWAQALYGMINVNRSSGGAAMRKMIAQVKDSMKQGRPLIIFPEGTRTKPGAKAAYKTGICFIAQNVDVPIIPVALNTGMFWGKKRFLKYPGKVIIEFLEPMPKGLGKDEFMHELENRIESKCREINAETVKNYPNSAKRLSKGE